MEMSLILTVGNYKMKFELKEYKPDKLDLQCMAIFEAMPEENIDYKISLLEQCIDYLRLEQAYKESK